MQLEGASTPERVGGAFREGYKRNKNVIGICSLLGDENIVPVHTSGHATPEAIRDVVEMTRPREKIIVIHKDKNSDRSLLNLPKEYKGKVVWNFEPGQVLIL